MARKDDYLSLEEDGASEARRAAASRRAATTRSPAGEDEYPAGYSNNELDERAGHAEDLDVEEESPFLRGDRRVPVRRGPLPKKAANRVKLVAIGLAVLVGCGGVAAALYNYGAGSWRFRIDSSDNLEIGGNHNVTRAQVTDGIARVNVGLVRLVNGLLRRGQTCPGIVQRLLRVIDRHLLLRDVGLLNLDRSKPAAHCRQLAHQVEDCRFILFDLIR